jgi:hypothetical protein
MEIPNSKFQISGAQPPEFPINIFNEHASFGGNSQIPNSKSHLGAWNLGFETCQAQPGL